MLGWENRTSLDHFPGHQYAGERLARAQENRKSKKHYKYHREDTVNKACQVTRVALQFPLSPSVGCILKGNCSSLSKAVTEFDVNGPY